MELFLRTEYWDDQKAREGFKVFIKQIHNLDFTAWESAGYWDDCYTPFSFFKGGQVVSSVCIYLLDAVIHGAHTPIAQISGVGTDPYLRRQGLNRTLTEQALAWAEDKTRNGFFLFADRGAVPYYKALGFYPVTAYVEQVNAFRVKPASGMVKLDPARPQDLQKIDTYAANRAPVSDIFSIMNKKLLMFHVLYSFRDHLFEIPALECLVSIEHKGDTLNVYEIIGARIPTFEELYPYITSTRESVVTFHFHTDKLGVKKAVPTPVASSNGFAKGPFPFERPVFPFTSHA